MSLPVIVLNVADHVNDVREQSPDVLVRKAATRFTLKNFEREIVEDRRAVVGVTGSNRTRVSGKHRIEPIVRFPRAQFGEQNAIRLHAQTGLHEF